MSWHCCSYSSRKLFACSRHLQKPAAFGPMSLLQVEQVASSCQAVQESQAVAPSPAKSPAPHFVQEDAPVVENEPAGQRAQLSSEA